MDHERVTISTTRMSCGVMELSRINEDTLGVLYALAGRLYHPSRGAPCAFFVFSDIVTEETNSDKLVRLVEKFELGQVDTSAVAENPKTGNIITVCTWNINHENFKKWYSEERVRKLRKVGS